MPKTITKLVTKAEEDINYILQDFKDPWNLDGASLWVMNANKKMVMKHQNLDVYDLLKSSDTFKIVKDASFFTILTCGWAAPLEELGDNAPSESPNRRRVRLLVGADFSGVVSVLRFQDDPDETIIDEGKANGTLAQAVDKLVKKKLKHEINKVIDDFKN